MGASGAYASSCSAIQEQVIRRSNSDRILSRMPTPMQNLLIEIKRIQRHVLPQPTFSPSYWYSRSFALRFRLFLFVCLHSIGEMNFDAFMAYEHGSKCRKKRRKNIN